jgi:hypothetical protein
MTWQKARFLVTCEESAAGPVSVIGDEVWVRPSHHRERYLSNVLHGHGDAYSYVPTYYVMREDVELLARGPEDFRDTVPLETRADWERHHGLPAGGHA